MIEVSRDTRTAFIDGEPIALGPAEYKTLVLFGIMGNRVVDRELFLDHPVRVSSDRNLIESRIHALRKKIGRDSIRCITNLGYAFTGEPIRFI